MPASRNSIDTLGNRVRAMRDRFVEGAEEKVAIAAMTTAEFAVSHTPVDVGTARSSWEAAIGVSPDGYREAYSPYPKIRSAVGTLEAGRFGETTNLSSALTAIQSVVESRKMGESLRIANAVGYMPVLRTLQVDPFMYQEAGKHGRDAAKKVKVLP